MRPFTRTARRRHDFMAGSWAGFAQFIIALEVTERTNFFLGFAASMAIYFSLSALYFKITKKGDVDEPQQS